MALLHFAIKFMCANVFRCMKKQRGGFNDRCQQIAAYFAPHRDQPSDLCRMWSQLYEVSRLLFFHMNQYKSFNEATVNIGSSSACFRYDCWHKFWSCWPIRGAVRQWRLTKAAYIWANSTMSSTAAVLSRQFPRRKTLRRRNCYVFISSSERLDGERRDAI